MRDLTALLLCACGALVACDHAVEPVLPPTPVAFEPPAAYERWHDEMEACSGISGDFGAIRWYMVPAGTSWEGSDGRQVSGEWRRPDRIYIARGRLENRTVVGHEILHFLLQEGGHPSPPFDEDGIRISTYCGP